MPGTSKSSYGEEKQVRLDIKQLQQQDLVYRSTKRNSQDFHTRGSYEHPQKGFHVCTNAQDLQDLNARTSQQDLHKSFSQGPVPDHVRTPEKMSPGPRQELLTRTSTRSCKDTREDVTRTSSRASHKDLYKIMQRPLTAFH